MPIQKGPLGNDIGSTEIAAGAVTYAKLASDIQRSGMKNRIINGAMVIDQRNAGASVTAGYGFSVDRWQIDSALGTGGKINQQQNAGSVTPPVGFNNYLGMTSTSAYSVLTGDAFALIQRLEGYNVADLDFGTANAKTITVSFWVRSSLTGTFGGALLNGAGNRSYPFSYTISAANTWEQKSITIAGDTSGTWLKTNGTGMTLSFGLGSGSTYSGTAGSWASGYYYTATGATSVVGTSGATFYITGVQLEAGSTATNFEYRQYGTELALCQRYYEKSFAIGTAPVNGVVNPNGGPQTGIPLSPTDVRLPTVYFKVPKRASSTITYHNTDAWGTASQWAWFTGSSWAGGATSAEFGGEAGFATMISASGRTYGQAVLISGNWTASAEL